MSVSKPIAFSTPTLTVPIRICQFDELSDLVRLEKHFSQEHCQLFHTAGTRFVGVNSIENLSALDFFFKFGIRLRGKISSEEAVDMAICNSYFQKYPSGILV